MILEWKKVGDDGVRLVLEGLLGLYAYKNISGGWQGIIYSQHSDGFFKQLTTDESLEKLKFKLEQEAISLLSEHVYRLERLRVRCPICNVILGIEMHKLDCSYVKSAKRTENLG